MKGNNSATGMPKGGSNNKHDAASSSSTTTTSSSSSKQKALNSTINNINIANINNQQSRLAFFDHLPRKQIYRIDDHVEGDRILHPSTIKLGELYNRGLILADDDRVTSLIAAFTDIIHDYKTPPKRALREDLDKFLSKQVQYLVDCRQISKGMGNLIKYVRYCISKCSPDATEKEAKAVLIRKLQLFFEERIIYPAESISRYVTSIIRDDDVILTFGSSPLIRQVLLTAAKSKCFRVVVIDTRPLNEGLLTMSALSDTIHCVYSPLSGAAAAMKDQDVTTVLLGASSLFSNGSMLAPAGTAMVASLAKAKQIPVIVASESYKFSEKVQLDSIVHNELGQTSEIAIMVRADGIATTTGGSGTSTAVAGAVGSSSAATAIGSSGTNRQFIPAAQMQYGYRGCADSNNSKIIMNQQQQQQSSSQMIDEPPPIVIPTQWHTSNNNSSNHQSSQQQQLPFNVLNLRYDLTPISNISVVATETGLIPPTSIPVLIREIQFDTYQSTSSSY